VPPPHHPTTPGFGRHGVEGAPGLYLISALLQGERYKAPLGKRQRRCSAAQMLSMEPCDAAPTMQ